ncbi:TetR/AcrR family transcriptional regulator [Massilia sp. TS11]|uniref:TetR/AcrR family transcriptional regulator n=1 Tax=Massilia sp. TS11 TaxID=2908003 RepID=UPI001EDBC697|nr:TetR/AcrR family transcriptional regulator [Massilia sp. TS11]MCG2584403.1 TetR/AcrR family transcriptional regulator [Massilia sp. TS11]
MDPVDTKTRLIRAMLSLLQRKGLHGAGLNELLAEAGAPKGVLYHHFPGGKTALAVAAIEMAAAGMAEQLEQQLAGGDPAAVLRAWLDQAEQRLAASDYASGCPLATVALESTPADSALRAALSAAFATLRTRIAAGLTRAGVAPAQADGLAALLIAAYEGGLLQARVAQNPEPMRLISASLSTLLPPTR